MNFLSSLSLGLILTLIVAGCGPAAPQLASVGGVITLKGRPVANIEVVFVPDGETSGRDIATYTDQAGNYAIVHNPNLNIGVPVGVHRVLLRDADLYLVPAGNGVDAESGEITPGQGVNPPPSSRKTSRVPLNYSDSAKTPLRNITVQAGTQTRDFTIE